MLDLVKVRKFEKILRTKPQTAFTLNLSRDGILHMLIVSKASRFSILRFQV